MNVPSLPAPQPIELGELRVSYVPDGSVDLPGLSWLPATTGEFWARHPGYLDGSGNLVANIGGLLVEHGERVLLIDAGFGPRTVPAEPGNANGEIRGGALLESLAALGRTSEEIEAVAITHLHVDHIGWLWRSGSGRLPFAGAEVLVAEPEWSQRDVLVAHGTGPEILDALAPQVRTITDGEEIFPGVHVALMPGHTPGHAAYIIRSGGKRLIAFGDALHSAVQIPHPELSAASDHDPVQSTAFRRRLVDELSAPDTLGFGIHFAAAQFGRVVRDGDVPAWIGVS